MTTLREAAEMALGTLQDVCARLLYRGVSKDAGHPDQIALEQARQTIQALKQATEQSKQKRDPIAWNGWIVREVLFDEGEPVGHRAPPQPEPEPVAIVVAAEYEDGSHAGHHLEWSGRNEANDYLEGTKLYTHPPQHPTETEAEYGSEADTEELLRVGAMPEPLRLAAMLEKTMQWPLHGIAADCLRRMHNEAQRKPLTDEQIIMLSQSAGVYIKINDDCDLLFARAIEKAHGIGGEE